MYSARIETINLRQIESEPKILGVTRRTETLSECAEAVSQKVCIEGWPLLNGFEIVVTYSRRE